MQVIDTRTVLDIFLNRLCEKLYLIISPTCSTNSYKLSILFWSMLLSVFVGCREEKIHIQDFHYNGLTMGTTYNIKFSSNSEFPQKKIDSILIAFNDELSTYIDASFISMINDGGEKSALFNTEEHRDFVKIFERAKQMFDLSNGFFDPTVKPLVDYWGFGEKKEKAVYDRNRIDQLMEATGFDKIEIYREGNQFYVQKENAEVSLDFSAIAKGYGVDLIGQELEHAGIENYMVEIGGETKTKGLNSKKKKWLLGVYKPVPGVKKSELIAYIEPDDKALATSGNYRNFYMLDGMMYSHTINPKTGESSPSDLLAVTVLADDCMTADAMATSCMVMGLEKAKQHIASVEQVEACFFFQEKDSIKYSYSKRFKEYIKN